MGTEIGEEVGSFVALAKYWGVDAFCWRKSNNTEEENSDLSDTLGDVPRHFG